VKILEKTGFSLIDYFENTETAVIVDSVKSGRHKVGELLSIAPEDLKQYAPLTSHYVGIPEALKMMRELDLKPPKRVHILGVEVEDPYTISETMSQKLTERLAELSEETHKIISSIAETGD
jgi:hydrogenase maturation protease